MKSPVVIEPATGFTMFIFSKRNPLVLQKSKKRSPGQGVPGNDNVILAIAIKIADANVSRDSGRIKFEYVTKKTLFEYLGLKPLKKYVF